jgi:hypothetical protein
MKHYLLYALVVAVVSAIATGCSDSNPLAPVRDGAALQTETTGDPVQFAARVATADQSRRMLTFMGCHDTVVAARNCEIVRLNGDTLAPIPFTDLGPFDSLHIQGQRQQNGYVIAHRIQMCAGTCFDVAFRDTIVTIDYAAGTFTVAGRSEVIAVDENTILWGSAIKRRVTSGNRYEYQYQIAQTTSLGTPTTSYRHDALIEFTDLQPGDIVEVKANIVGEGRLLALAIKLANCQDFDTRCVKFEAVIATLDVEARTVTFVGLAWLGTVCNGAQLLDADGLPITLADFGVGELVAAKGLPLEGDELKICWMTKL